MKKNLTFSFFFIMIIFLISCNQMSDDYVSKYTDLTPNEDGEYLIYTVGDEITWEDLRKHNIENAEIIYTSSLKDANEEYPRLNLKQSPAYVLFDKKGLILKTYDYEELVQELKK